MGSKMPPPKKPAQDGGPEDDALVRTPLPGGGTSRLLSRIADALQVPQAALYDSQAVSEGEEASGTAADLDSECLALLQAFRRIRSVEERRRLLTLVQEAAGQA